MTWRCSHAGIRRWGHRSESFVGRRCQPSSWVWAHCKCQVRCGLLSPAVPCGDTCVSLRACPDRGRGHLLNPSSCVPCQATGSCQWLCDALGWCCAFVIIAAACAEFDLWGDRKKVPWEGLYEEKTRKPFFVTRLCYFHEYGTHLFWHPIWFVYCFCVPHLRRLSKHRQFSHLAWLSLLHRNPSISGWSTHPGRLGGPSRGTWWTFGITWAVLSALPMVQV